MVGQTRGEEPEKEYILYFYDGKVRRVFGKRSQFQKLPVSRIEEATPGYDPFSNVRWDMERINRGITGERMPITFERVLELLELDASNLDLEDQALLLGLSRSVVDREGEQYLSKNKYLLKDQFEYLRSL